MNEININGCKKLYNFYVEKAEKGRQFLIKYGNAFWLENLSIDELFDSNKIELAKRSYFGEYII